MMNKDDADLLVLAILKLPILRQTAINKAKEFALFDELMFTEHSMIWNVVKDLASAVEIDSEIPLIYVENELKKRFVNAGKDTALTSALELTGIAGQAEAADLVNFNLASKILDAFCVAGAKSIWINKLQQLHSASELSNFINQVNTTVTDIQTTKAAEISMPLLHPEMFLVTSKRDPIGVSILDELSEGGHSKGETVGIMAPTGGGKTTLAINCVMEQGIRAQHVALFTYEQGIKGDISERLYCLMFGDRPIDFFRNNKPSEWSAEDIAIYKEKANKIGKYVHVIDYADKKDQGYNGIQDIRGVVTKLSEQGCLPRYIIIDWLWPMLMRYCAGHNIPAKEDTYRTLATMFFNDLSQLTKEFGLTAITFHQLATDVSRASASYKPKVTDAMGFRSFAYLQDVCYLIGNRDKQTNVCWALTDKSRRGQCKEMLVRLNGEYCRFEKATGMIQNSRGRFVREDEAVSEEEDTYYGSANPYGV